jgi:hypothetical protein
VGGRGAERAESGEHGHGQELAGKAHAPVLGRSSTALTYVRPSGRMSQGQLRPNIRSW